MASVGFRWLDILEKEFDKAFVDLDLTVGELDSEEPVIVYNVRQKLCTLSSCFAQLTHKAQTIFQNSAKIEAELIHMRAELVDSKAKREILEQELHNLLLQLHTTQLSQIPKANGTFKPDPSFKPDVNSIKKRLENEMKKSPSHIVSVKSASGGETTPSSVDEVEFNPSLVELKQLRCENYQLQQENVALRNQSLALNSEVYGAKLAAKYLDKELAGRIQQLQLLGREMRGDVRDKLWRQLESEILLQRHKTVVRECRRNSIINGNDKSGGGKRELAVPTLTEHFGDVRTVIVRRKPSQGLGISITGGREHGVPILISELEPNGPAALSGELYIGDAILSVNEKDLRQACHKDAVDILKQNCEECRLQVQYIAADDSDNSLEEDGFHFRFFDHDVCDPNDANSVHGRNNFNTPTAPRTPESVSYQSGTTSRLNDRDSDFLTTSADPVKPYQVSPEIQKVIDSLQTKDVYSFSAHLSNHSNIADHPSTPNNNAKDFLTGHDDDVLFHNVNMNINNDINRNADTAITKFPRNDLILLDNRHSLMDDYKKTSTGHVPVADNFNCSTNSLNSENLSSPMQTSTDMFMDSEVLSTDMASNDSHSPKTNDANIIKFSEGNKFEAIYGSNETFSNTKSDQSLLNSSSESSPVHKSSREYKKTKKYKSKKYFGVKTLQSIFSKHDGYSDISSNASDCPDDEPLAKEVENLKLDLEMDKTPMSVAHVATDTQSESQLHPQTQEAHTTVTDAPPEQTPSDTTTYKYRTILTETSPQFEENIHSFLSEIFMKNFQTPDTPETTATTSKMGTKRYLRVGKALRLCSNEDNAAALNDYEQRREKLLARYVYNSNSLSADGEGNPDFGTPV